MKITRIKALLTKAFLHLTLITLSALAVSCTNSETPQKDIRAKAESLSSDAQEEVCEMINGKLECTYKKAVRDAKDIKENIEESVKED